MRPKEGCEVEILKLLASMPLMDRLEMVCVSGWSRGAVYPAIEKLEASGLLDSLLHASDLVPPTRRYHLTASGVSSLSQETGTTVETLLRTRPVSSQWRRVLLERLDALAVIYRVASAVCNVAHPIRFRWYRAMPMDAAIALPGGRAIAIVRQGPTSDRTAFSKRIWRLREGPRPSTVLVLASDDVRLRHARRMLAGAHSIAFLALERDAASAGTGSPIWRTPSGSTLFDLRTALSYAGFAGEWVAEDPLERATLPDEIKLSDTAKGVPDWLLPAVLKPSEKLALDLISDWPWIYPSHLGALMGVRRAMLSRILSRLQELKLAVSRSVEGSRRIALSDRGLSTLARRDRAAVGAAKRRWSVTPQDKDSDPSWQNVSGRRSRQLLRNMEHTGSVHWFLAALASQAAVRGWEIIQLDPPRRASRHFRHVDGLRSIQPDAFGILRRDGKTIPFFLEWERRAVRPVTMTDRIAPYLRYYSSQRPTDDHGFQPSVLVVFEDEIPQTHFLRVAREEMQRTGVSVPLLVSNMGLLERVGPLGPAWLDIHSWEPAQAFTSP